MQASVFSGEVWRRLQYDYRTGGEHRKKHAARHQDASGRDEPYDPDWGNYGARRPQVLPGVAACVHHDPPCT